MKIYSIGLDAVLALPGKTFWMLHRSIDRMDAETDQRQLLTVAHGMAGGDGFMQLMERLQKRIGSVIEFTEESIQNNTSHPALQNTEFDETGFESLRGLGRL